MAEAEQTYVQVTRLTDLAQGPAVALLDVCYGLGYNSAAALAAIWRINPQCRVTLRALEIDAEVPRAAIAQHLMAPWPDAVQQILGPLAKTHHHQTPRLDAQLLVGDARQRLPELHGWQADAVFLDPFSPTRCPQLWTVDFLRGLATCLKPTGRLATYSCAAAVRAALIELGLNIGSTVAAGRQWPGTVASHTETDLPTLSPREYAHLNTRAAVIYCDPMLTATAEEIKAERAQRQQQSPLMATGQWRRQWL